MLTAYNKDSPHGQVKSLQVKVLGPIMGWNNYGPVTFVVAGVPCRVPGVFGVVAEPGLFGFLGVDGLLLAWFTPLTIRGLFTLLRLGGVPADCAPQVHVRGGELVLKLNDC